MAMNKRLKAYMMDAKVVRSMLEGLDHYVIVMKLKMHKVEILE